MTVDSPGPSCSISHGNAVTQPPAFATNVIDGGSTSAISTRVATAGPRLVTRIAYCAASPGWRIVGPICSIRRSAWSAVATVVVSRTVLFAVAGSGSVAVTVAVFVNSPGPPEVAAIVTVAVAAGARVPSVQTIAAHEP